MTSKVSKTRNSVLLPYKMLSEQPSSMKVGKFLQEYRTIMIESKLSHKWCSKRNWELFKVIWVQNSELFVYRKLCLKYNTIKIEQNLQECWTIIIEWKRAHKYVVKKATGFQTRLGSPIVSLVDCKKLSAREIFIKLSRILQEYLKITIESKLVHEKLFKKKLSHFQNQSRRYLLVEICPYNQFAWNLANIFNNVK